MTGYMDKERLNHWKWEGDVLRRKRPLYIPDGESLGRLFDELRSFDGAKYTSFSVLVDDEEIKSDSTESLIKELPRRNLNLTISGRFGWLTVDTTGRGSTTVLADEMGLVSVVSALERSCEELGWIRRCWHLMPWSTPISAASTREREAVESQRTATRAAWIGGVCGFFGGAVAAIATVLVSR